MVGGCRVLWESRGCWVWVLILGACFFIIFIYCFGVLGEMIVVNGRYRFFVEWFLGL